MLCTFLNRKAKITWFHRCLFFLFFLSFLFADHFWFWLFFFSRYSPVACLVRAKTICFLFRVFRCVTLTTRRNHLFHNVFNVQLGPQADLVYAVLLSLRFSHLNRLCSFRLHPSSLATSLVYIWDYCFVLMDSPFHSILEHCDLILSMLSWCSFVFCSVVVCSIVYILQVFFVSALFFDNCLSSIQIIVE